ncbi:MAG: cellulose biosynthesis protein BcsQ [Legionellales bacterium]
MPVIALQGICEGTGVTSITAGLAWALHTLGETVLTIDLSKNNMLRLQFNTPFDHPQGWARSLIDGKPWQNSTLKYRDSLDYLPFGTLSIEEAIELENTLHGESDFWPMALRALLRSEKYQWILVDTGSASSFFSQQAHDLADRLFVLLNPNANCQVRIHQQDIPEQANLLINKYNPVSTIQSDLHRLWIETLPNAMDLLIHQDEALAESPAKKQPVGQYSPDSLAAQELISLANWCLINASEPLP